jgi:hypothetical protein
MLVAAAVAPRAALGDDEKKRDPVRAQALFAEARRQLEAGNYEAACPKFADSETLDPAPGTALNLAVCYKKAGKLASAWEAFQSAEALAVRAGQTDRAKGAKNEASALEGRLSRLTVSVPQASQVPGLDLLCDKRPILRSEWGLALPQDGGVHEIEASAPGKKRWQTHVELRQSEQNLTVEVPRLEDEPSAAASTGASGGPSGETTPPSQSAPPAASGDSANVGAPGQTQRIVGLAVGGAGVVGMGVGGIMALVAKSQFGSAQNEHGSARADDSASAVHLANTGGVIIAISAGVTAAGAILWFVAPRTAAPQVGTNGSQLLLRGNFQ